MLYAKEYNSSPENNRLVRSVKTYNIDAIKQMAREMAHKVQPGCNLIPVPNRSGHAGSMLLLCQELSKLANCTVHDIVRGRERKSMYDAKKAGELLNEDDFGYYIDGKIPNGNIYFVDNVLATGTTMKYLRKLIPNADILVHSVDWSVKKVI